MRPFIFWDVPEVHDASLHGCKPLTKAFINLYAQSFETKSLGLESDCDTVRFATMCGSLTTKISVLIPNCALYLQIKPSACSATLFTSSPAAM